LYEQFKRESDERKQLSKKLIDLLEADRFSVARDLHDHIGQNLTTLKLDLERLVHSKTADAVSSAELLDRAKLKVDLVMREVKNLARGLRPVALDVLGLVPSLRSLFTEIQESSGIEIDFFYTEVPERLDRDKKLGIYRIAQEAMTNILKHAEANEVQVNLIAKEDVISISVEDDGVGFDYIEFGTGPHVNESLGLVLMKERAIQLNGEFSLESRPGYGTQVLIEIPV
jgi:signal transduction histidine kinase